MFLASVLSISASIPGGSPYQCFLPSQRVDPLVVLDVDHKEDKKAGPVGAYWLSSVSRYHPCQSEASPTHEEDIGSEGLTQMTQIDWRIPDIAVELNDACLDRIHRCRNSAQTSSH
ncbi:hypothetical protein ROHU_025706 [Labeo rohita]|uniref:Uncharacterized protein n=1 Tax=Labeo rohita TaxID=84645 RepID=A0A498MJJ5_LABRO|nr:hypothetical protein ROHU_025706 [Labeo rohita]